jgi:hypothetical protein
LNRRTWCSEDGRVADGVTRQKAALAGSAEPTYAAQDYETTSMDEPQTTDVPWIPAELLDKQGRVRVDLPCRGCGYNVRTLEPAARCPECNTPISLSCQGDLLRYSEPGYVRRLARGAYWVRQATWLALVVIVLRPVLVLCVRGLTTTPLPSAVWAASTVCTAVLAVAGALALAGIWWVTTAEPDASDLLRPKRPRQIVRCCVGAALLMAAVKFCIEGLPPLLPVRALLVLDLALATMLTGLAIAYLRYLAELAQRIPDSEMMQKARSIARDVLVAAGVLISFEAINLVLGPGTISANPPSTTAPAAGQPAFALRMVGSCVSLVAGLALFVLSISAIRLQWRVCRSLRGQAELAQKNWGNAGI